MNKKLFLIFVIVLLPFACQSLSTVLASVIDIKKLNEKIKEYEYVGIFHEGFAAVVKNGKIGFIDKSGDWVIPMKWDATNQKASRLDEDVMFNNGRCYIPQTVKSKFPPTMSNAYIIDKKGNELYFGKSIDPRVETTFRLQAVRL